MSTVSTWKEDTIMYCLNVSWRNYIVFCIVWTYWMNCVYYGEYSHYCIKLLFCCDMRHDSWLTDRPQLDYNHYQSIIEIKLHLNFRNTIVFKTIHSSSNNIFKLYVKWYDCQAAHVGCCNSLETSYLRPTKVIRACEPFNAWKRLFRNFRARYRLVYHSLLTRTTIHLLILLMITQENY
jgi:hypothetical protein